MPQRSKKTDNAIGALILIILLIFVILFLVVIITPIFLLLGFIIHLIKSQQFKNKVQGTLSDFWLNNEQKRKFKFLLKTIDSANIGIKEAYKIADSNGLSRNMDGSISARSKLGKELRNTIEKNQEIISQNEDDFVSLKNLPHSQWIIFSKIYTRKNSFAFGLIFYIVSALILTKTMYNNLRIGIENFISFPSKIIDGSLAETEDITIMVITIGSSAFAFMIASLIFKRRTKKISPIPPLVDINNVDKY